jgi:peptide/nickel transport system substrate-binding protein
MSRRRTFRELLMPRLALGLGMGLFVAAALAASGTRARANVVKEGDTLTVGSPAFDFIDPALLPDPPTSNACGTCTTAMWAVADATCAMLYRYPPTIPPVADYTLLPEVATGDPALSRNGRIYTFTIRKGFRFNTGAPVTAANFKRAFERLRDPATSSPAAQYFQEVADVRAAGNQLVVRLTKPVPDFPARMTTPYLCPVPARLPIAPEGVAALPGSGPYFVSEFVRGNRVVLKRNRYYRGTRAHHVDQIVVLIGDPEGTTAAKVMAGQVDVDLSGGGTTGRVIQDEIVPKYGINKQRFFSIHAADMLYLLMNTERPLFKNNPKLRQAVNFALDRTAMLRVSGAANGRRTDSYLPSGVPGYRDVHPYGIRYPDLAKARALAKGNLRGRKAILPISDNVNVLAERQHAEVIKYDLKQIGIDVELKVYPSTTIRNAQLATRGAPFDLAHVRYLVPWVDPYQYVDLLLDGRTIQPIGNTNRSYFNSPHYNRLIDRAGRLSGQARYDAYGELALDIAKNAAPMAGIINRNTRVLVSSRIGCVRAVGVAAHGVDLAGLCLR